MENINTISWKLIDTYFENDYLALINHHLESYNDFFNKSEITNSGIVQIFNEMNPIKIRKNKIDSIKDYGYKIDIYIGGKDASKIYYGLPVINESDNNHYMYPNEARLKNLTYSISVHYDVYAEFTELTVDKGETITKKDKLEYNKIFLGKFPIMLQSNFCILHDLPKQIRFNMGECLNDKGGYFIIDGKEKCFIPQEVFANNMINYTANDKDINYSHTAAIRCVSEDSSKPARTMKVHIKKSNGTILVEIPNVRKPIPLFILMRALGITSDKDIISYCLLDLEKNRGYLDAFISSVHDGGIILTQELALKYISIFTKKNTVIQDILINYFLPNVGEDNFINKAYFLGNIVLNLLQVKFGVLQVTDRDNFKYKRVELIGTLMYDLFREYYVKQQKSIKTNIERKFYFLKNEKNKLTIENSKKIFDDNFKGFLFDRKIFGIVEEGFKKAFKGNWGASSHTKRVGVIQDLNRLSFNSAIGQLRKLNLEMDASAKVQGPRLLHSSQYGIIDPIDTPDGGNVGTHKHLTMMAKISNNISGFKIKEWLFKTYDKYLIKIEKCKPNYLYYVTKIMLNGIWIASTNNPTDLVNDLKNKRRLGKFENIPNNISKTISITFHIKLNVIYIFTDSGRLMRPLYYTLENKDKESKISILSNENVLDKVYKDDINWNDFLYYIDYLDSCEIEDSYICLNVNDYNNESTYTHVEIEHSLIFGVLGNQVIFPEHNPPSRNLFSCGQAKQGVSMYHTNYQNRVDKTSLVLNYGQTPLIKSRYLKYINNNEQPYGVNAIVAIMSTNGYNVEDAILINEGSIRRGLFYTTYYSTYEMTEESSEVEGSTKDKNIRNVNDIVSVKLDKDLNYKNLDSIGLIKEGTFVNDKTVIIGGVSSNPDKPNELFDNSMKPKKGQLGYVDKSFISNNETGFRVGKVKIREQRTPQIGDKMVSRAGQKGTIGLIIPESDMPFTKDGLKPDLIINPHAIPSRMTIGQLLEVLLGKGCTELGLYGDCTSFQKISSSKNREEIYGDILVNNGYHSSGNEILYDGITGSQLESSIFIGPTYYLRLKHIVKDKINYRADGPLDLLTRQTVQGRANDGGLRIGEMERDGVISHGMSHFLKDSFMVRGDEYNIAICNQTGKIALYDIRNNSFYSPLIDGKVKYQEPIRDDSKIDVLHKYGVSFSIVKVPYCLKLLIQELQTMNVDMKLITQDNINQLLNMNNDIKLNEVYKKEKIIMSDDSTNYNIINEKLEDEKVEDEENKIDILENNIVVEDETIEDANEENESDDLKEELELLEFPKMDDSIYTINTEIPKYSNVIDFNNPNKMDQYSFYPLAARPMSPINSPIVYTPTSPEEPPPAELSPFRPTTPDEPPPADLPLFTPSSPEEPPPASLSPFRPTTPDYPPPRDFNEGYKSINPVVSLPVEEPVETIDKSSFKNMKDEVDKINNKSILIQDESKEKDEEKDDNDVKGVAM